MKLRNTIFQHLFIRMAVILLGISFAFSFALMPIYNDKLIRMLAAQGNTFANTAIAACGEALYTKEYSLVITYVNKVLRQTPEISYVNFVSSKGMRLSLSADDWKVEMLKPTFDETLSTEEQGYTIAHSRGIDNSGSASKAFIFSKPVNISGLAWGRIELGISDAEFESLKTNYFRNVFLSSIVLVTISLLILRGVSMKLAQQLTQLRDTAQKLSEGDLSARAAPSQAIGEVHLLANTLNAMSQRLEVNTRNMRQLARLVEDTNDAIVIFGDDERIDFVNPAFMHITNQSFDVYRGMSLKSLFDHLGIEKNKQHQVSEGITHMGDLDWSIDITISTPERGAVYMTFRVEKFDAEDNTSNGFFVVLSDITQRKQLEFELETLAYMDKLTKLPNRRYFMDRLHEAVKEAELFNSGLAVFFLDLDNFKLINDSLGHEVGDWVLSEAAWRIQHALRSDDIVCRLGGDEFTVIIKDVVDKQELAKIAETIIEEFRLPIEYMERELRISASIGIVRYPDDGHDETDLIKNADNAMYAAKSAGKNALRFFTQDMHRDLHDYMELESALRKAIENSDLELHYQPFVDVDSQTISACEALLRWKHPEQGYISPARFIPIAEQSGLMNTIGDWVFTEVCRQLTRWNFDINVSINVSGSELINKRFAERLKETLVEYDIEAYRLQLEFTEHVLISQDNDTLTILNTLKRMGFSIAVDDFGTGFSSLSYLTELPVDVIKIDKAFINKLPHDRRTIAVVNAIISLAENLDILTIGEGAENKSQVEWLRGHGCRTIQGFHYHKPMPPQELENLMSEIKVTRFPPPKLIQGRDE